MSHESTTRYLEKFNEMFEDAFRMFIADPVRGKQTLLELYRYDAREQCSVGFDQLDFIHHELISILSMESDAEAIKIRNFNKIYLAKFMELFKWALEIYMDDPKDGKNKLVELCQFDIDESGAAGFERLDPIYQDLIVYWINEKKRQMKR